MNDPLFHVGYTFIKVQRVRSSLLFPGVVIHENAIVEHAILDKGVEVAAGVTIRGTEEAPVVVKKERLLQRILSNETIICCS